MSDMSNPPQIDGFLRLPEVKAIAPVSTATIYRRMERGDFPRQYDIGGGLVGWKRSEIERWAAERQKRR